MVSINTNLSSLMVQKNLTNSTNGLNKAIERLSTGYKINHSSDNAANYSIANNYEAKLSSFDMAADNVGMGSDLLAVAQDTISSMQDHGARLHALITQARNGTYGAQSLNALTQEAGALISEIQRMYTNTEYNNVSLFDRVEFMVADYLPKAGASGFIDEEAVGGDAGLLNGITPKSNGFIADIETVTPDVVVESSGDLADAIANNSTIGIANARVLAKLATLVNSGTNCEGKTIVLTDNIDLSDYQAGEGWTAIGTSLKRFNGTFDGQGHKVTGLKINKGSTDYQGLFGFTNSDSEIKNVGIIDCDITGKNYTGGLVGRALGSIINSYATGTVTGTEHSIGGLAGQANSIVTNCYAAVTVSGRSNVGGLIGQAYTGSSVTDCFATGTVTGTGEHIGGLVGESTTGGSITKSYATGAVSGTASSGGLAGYVGSSNTVSNSYATGAVSGTASSGGLVGYAGTSSIITNSYATGTVSGAGNTGGLVGYANNNSSVISCYATGNVSGTNSVGGLIGVYSGSVINTSYSTGTINGEDFVGGLVGRLQNTNGGGTVRIKNSASYSKIESGDKAGSFVGGYVGKYDTYTYTLTLDNCQSAMSDRMDMIGGYCTTTDSGSTYTKNENYDMSTLLKNLSGFKFKNISTRLQVGIMADESSKIDFNTNFDFDLSPILRDIKSDDAYNAINKFMSTLSDKATELGSVSNRLESALDSIVVNMENITSSLSTIKDADMATESSQYIKMQILQQASATLLATANQSPSIALQLI